MASLSLKNVCKVYPNGFVAVKDFNLEIADQEFIIFVGPSGCGKSTTLRMIAGLEEISSGELWIGDKMVNDVEPKDRDIAMVFQNYALYPHMSVYDNMAFGLKLRKVPKAEIDKAVHEAAKILDIEHLLDRKPKALSGGQRQRVAMTLGTRIVVLKDGIIQQVDTPQNLYNTPNNIFVAGFIGSPQMNLIDAEVKANGSQVDLVLSDTVTITLPAEKSKKLIDGNYVGKTVVVGIRPEDVKDDAEFIAKNADSKFTATVKVYELLGAEVNLHYEIGDVTCTAKVNPRTTARPGDEVTFAMDVERLHVFDKETEIVITH